MKGQNHFYVAFLVVLLSACNNGGTDPVKDAKTENKEMIDSQASGQQRDSTTLAALPSKEDADFLVNSASGGMLEVQLGQLAQTNSRDQRVKAFGAMMIRDHGEGGEKLKALAASKNITLPGSVSNSQQKEKERLQNLKGDVFDQAYINMMTEDHKGDIAEFEKEAAQGTNPDIKTFAAKTLPMLYVHLDSASSIQKMLVKKMPPEKPEPIK